MKNKISYVMKKLEVTSKNLDDFKLFDNRRILRKVQVRKLVELLENGGHFETPLAVNQNKGKYWILDGNHRHEAMKKFFIEHPNKQLDIWAMVYSIDDNETIRQKFRDLNAGLKPTSDDFLQQYANSHKILVSLIKSIPEVDVYATNNKRCLKLRLLLGSYFNATEKNFTADFVTPTELMHRVDQLTQSDVNTMIAFVREYQSIFGMLTKQSVWLKSTIFASIMRLWYVNKDKIPFTKMEIMFKKLIGHPNVLEYAKIGGRESTVAAAYRFAAILNERTSKYHWIV